MQTLFFISLIVVIVLRTMINTRNIIRHWKAARPLLQKFKEAATRRRIERENKIFLLVVNRCNLEREENQRKGREEREKEINKGIEARAAEFDSQLKKAYKEATAAGTLDKTGFMQINSFNPE